MFKQSFFFLIALVLILPSLVTISSIFRVIIVGLSVFYALRVKDLVEESINLIQICFPSLRLHTSPPSLQILILIKAASLDILVVCP